ATPVKAVLLQKNAVSYSLSFLFFNQTIHFATKVFKEQMADPTWGRFCAKKNGPTLRPPFGIRYKLFRRKIKQRKPASNIPLRRRDGCTCV
ncbi:MAG: hypothetical protein Q7S86_02910, partial [bacterium]|nr:hypothetical protein [bacterium]